MAARVSQTGVVSVGEGTPKVRTSQTGAAVVGTGTPKARVSQAGAGVVWQGTPNARVSQTGLLVIVPVAAAGGLFPFLQDAALSGGPDAGMMGFS